MNWLENERDDITQNLLNFIACSRIKNKHVLWTEKKTAKDNQWNVDRVKALLEVLRSI